MIDTHAHLDFKDFGEDREEVISRAFDNGVKNIINIGVDLETSRKSIEIAKDHEKIFASVGVHPDYFTKVEPNKDRPDWDAQLEKISKNGKVVAIGEIGLDYYYIARDSKIKSEDFARVKKRQLEGFILQIEIARKLNLPVIVHCRDAWEDLYRVIVDYSNVKSELADSLKSCQRNPGQESIVNFVLHCYTGEKDDTEKFLELPNVHFSFSGNITYPKPAERAEKMAEAVRTVPLERIMLDSDAPFLAPQEFRGKRNEPGYVDRIAEKIAKIKNVSVSEVEKITDKNAKEFFKI